VRDFNIFDPLKQALKRSGKCSRLCVIGCSSKIAVNYTRKVSKPSVAECNARRNEYDVYTCITLNQTGIQLLAPVCFL
jgi:hypothetical protein